MGRFLETSKGKSLTENYEGEKAYQLTPEMELYTAVCTASLQPKFYIQTPEDELRRIRNLISKVSPSFVSNLAIYAREKMYLRSIPLVLAIELAKIHRGDNLVSSLVERIIQRADEITELLGYYEISNEREDVKKLNKLSNQIKKGIKNSFSKFDEYQFAKYNRKSAITLKDAIFLTHPKETELLKKIIEDKLEIPYTWEVMLSEKGNKKEVWEELIDSKKVGYMATLRNLRNILQAGVSIKHLEKVSSYIASKEAVEKSKQLPFRFLSAYRELKEVSSPYTSSILEALEGAIKHSSSNIKGFDLDTTIVIACDMSSSMENPLSERSKIKYFEIGLVLGMLLQSKCKSVISSIFGEDFKVVQLPRTNILSNADGLARRIGEVGHSTNGYKTLDYLTNNRIKADKIMIFTDLQMWDSNQNYYGYNDSSRTFQSAWKDYKQIFPESKLYLFDLAGYGNTPLDVSNKDVSLIAGWSDKIFDCLSAIENGEKILGFIK